MSLFPDPDPDKDLILFEKLLHHKGYRAIAGVDEAGRGPLAGPVVAAAVILSDFDDLNLVDDSKKLSPKQRQAALQQVRDRATAIGIGVVDWTEIDQINILAASLKAMRLAVESLDLSPDYLMIDGIFTLNYDLPQQAIRHGDARSLSIAAASIVAKVTRDDLMQNYDQLYPGYGFAKHMGYGTAEHKRAIAKLGPCPIHRMTFKGVKEYTGPAREAQVNLTLGLRMTKVEAGPGKA
ncbi:MAG: ribonuclease HII [Deltaproteobacteria bacterium]|nr:ribonuclease HII [Deltaproteobacteria bacterium]MBF0526009.1 ribonuclease HII [Deltaproteobacteria bacterium]